MRGRGTAVLGASACALGFLTFGAVGTGVASAAPDRASTDGPANTREADSPPGPVSQSSSRATPAPAGRRQAALSTNPAGRGAVRPADTARAAVPAPARATRALPAAATPSSPLPAPTAASNPAPAAPVAAPVAAPSTTGAITPAPTLPAGPAGKLTAAAVPSNPITDFINGIVLLFQQLFVNQAPMAAPVQAMTRPSGQVWGFVAGSDPEGDPLTYTLNQKPRFGTVTVSATGVYSYSPGADFAGTDTFTVTIADPGTPFALLNFLSGHTRDVTVSVKTSTGPTFGTVVDTFDGPADSAPDPALWGYHLGALRDDGLQTYTDSVDNVRLDGQGNLVIQARPSADGYTSTRLVTQDRLEMQYGTVEARIKMPAGQGIWPAFWMLGTSYYPEFWERWPECGEIDIMEVVNTGTYYTVALHGPQGDTDYYGGVETGRFVGNQGPISAVAPIQDLSANYHDYWMMWREDQIVIGVDNTRLGEFTPASLPEGAEWVFNQPMYGILQIAVGGPWPGPPDAMTPWPATMLVDSFRYTPLR